MIGIVMDIFVIGMGNQYNRGHWKMVLNKFNKNKLWVTLYPIYTEIRIK